MIYVSVGEPLAGLISRTMKEPDETVVHLPYVPGIATQPTTTLSRLREEFVIRYAFPARFEGFAA